jgi:hypothetical protein
MEKYAFYLPFYTYDKWKKTLGYTKIDKEEDLMIRLIMCRVPRLYCKNVNLYHRQIIIAEKIIKMFALPKMVTICVLLRQLGMVNDIIYYIINQIPASIKID